MTAPAEGTPSLAPAVDALPSVGLDELTSHAALQTRVDRKYVLTLPAASALLEGLADQARVLEIDGRRTFGYESVYFDTDDLACYLLAARRRPGRFKVRSRTYTDSDQCWLEVKTRNRRGVTVKHRLAQDPLDRATLTGEGYAFITQVLDRAGFAQPDGGPLHPTLVTEYARTTLYVPSDDSRVTIDTTLTCVLPPGGPQTTGGRTAALDASAVVETKTAGRPSMADRLLWRHGHRPLRLSKYGTGLAALRPDLPATPWNPVLGRHPFTTSDGDAR